MEEDSKKDIRDIITRLTHPVSITEGNRGILTSPPKTTFLSIFNGGGKRDAMVCSNFELEEIRDSCTQTSKTIIQLAKIEAGDISPDSLGDSPRAEATETTLNESYSNTYSEYTTCSRDVTDDRQPGCPVEPLNLTEADPSRSPSLIETFLQRSRDRPGKDYTRYLPRKSLKSRSCVLDSYRPGAPDGERRFMMPTVASEQKSLLPEVRRAAALLTPIRRGRSCSPKATDRGVPGIPYIDQSETELRAYPPARDGATLTAPNRRPPVRKIATPSLPNSFSKDMLRIDEMSLVLLPTENNSAMYLSDPNCSSESNINGALARMQDNEWSTALRGLAEVTELCRAAGAPAAMMPHMVAVNQRLIQLLRCPRSHVCRTACQAAGHLFESMRDTRGPEFNDIVDVLLAKTADANKFIRRDANLALDCMVTHVPASHAVKALCSKGPTHKNNLVRSATVRLLICAVVIAGPGVILSPSGSETTRKRIFAHLARFVEDKYADTRKYGERLYKVLSKEPYFDTCLKKYIDRDDLSKMKKALKALSRK